MKKDSFKKISEKISVFVAQKPAKAILVAILLFNVVFLCFSALLISHLAPTSLQNAGFWASVFYTITMILDAGCIQFVVADVGKTGVSIIIICILIVLIGMISFTGAVIGYVTNYISNFIDNANSGARKLKITNHNIIINWNTRASEIINDLLYSESKEKIVVLVNDGKDAIEREIYDRISDTISRENKNLRIETANMNFIERHKYLKEHILKNNLTIIVREGDVYSSKSLNDISVADAKSIIILGKDIHNSLCKFEYEERIEDYGKGNSNTVKTLIQVADITASEDSADNQKIVVEVEDEWTYDLVNQIIKHKENLGKCNIVPVATNRILGQILSQFSVMPELNYVYNELFSNKGAFFASKKIESDKEEYEYIQEALNTNNTVIPLTTMKTKEGDEAFFMVNSEKALNKNREQKSYFKCHLNKNFWLEKKNIIVLGHNSKISSIMDGFSSFADEWNFPNGDNILNIVIVDDKKSLEKNNYFREYPYVSEVIEADIYEKDKIYKAIWDFSESHDGDTSVLILSDDMALTEEIDAKALTFLIYVNELIQNKKAENKDFKPESIDVIVEVLNPKNYDVVCSYSINNVVISNRYISKMITQIGEREAIYDFYTDILTYDTEGAEEYDSKELYIKKAGEFFEELPTKSTAFDLIRGVFADGPQNNKSLLLGYIRNETEKVMFVGNQNDIEVELKADDKLIIFSNH